MPGNDLTTNPWVLDTPSATDLHPIGPVWIEQIVFFNYTLDTDTCTLTDRNGVTVWVGNGSNDLQTVRSGKIGIVLGLKLTALSGGAQEQGKSQVLVYIK